MKQNVSSIRRRVSAACLGIAMLLSLLGCMLLGFEDVATDPTRYTALQDRFRLYGEIGVSREEMVPAMEAIAAYLRGETAEYNRDVTMFGTVRPLFNDREVAHMVDVVDLFQLERTVRTASLLAAAILVLLGFALGCGQIARSLRMGLFTALGLFAALAAFCAAAYLIIGFEDIFLGFHHLFFTNDLWLMDYNRDAMIRMFPSPFFETLLTAILIRMAACALECALVWTAVCILARFWGRGKPDKTN